MNHIYKVVYCKATGTFVAVAEYAKAQGKGGTGSVGSSSSVGKFAKGFALTAVSSAVALVGQSAFAAVAVGGNGGFQGNAIRGSASAANGSIAVGDRANASMSNTIAIGNSANTTKATGGVATTGSLTFREGEAIAIGNNSSVDQYGHVALGSQATIKTPIRNKDGAPGDLINTTIGDKLDQSLPSVAVGFKATARGDMGDVIIGAHASNNFGRYVQSVNEKGETQPGKRAISQSTAVGSRAFVMGDQSTALGADANAIGNSSIAIGGDDIDTAIPRLKQLFTGVNLEKLETVLPRLKNATAEDKRIRGLLNSESAFEGANSTKANDNNYGTRYVRTSAIGDASLAVGPAAQSLGVASMTVGINAIAEGDASIAQGVFSRARAINAMAVGSVADAVSNSSLALGHGATAGSQELFDYYTKLANGNYSADVKENARKMLQIGFDKAVAVGASAKSRTVSSIAIGDKADSGTIIHSIAIGRQATAEERKTSSGNTTVMSEGSGHVIYSNPYNEQTKIVTKNTENKNILAYTQNGTAIRASNIAIGNESESGGGGVAVGDRARTERGTSTANLGQTKGSLSLGVAVGASALSRGGGIAVGSAVEATGNNSLAFGRQAAAIAHGSQAIGAVSAAVGEGATAIGHSATALGKRSIAFGASHNDGTYTTYDSTNNTVAKGLDSIAIGTISKAEKNNTIAIGTGAVAKGTLPNQAKAALETLANNVDGQSTHWDIRLAIDSKIQELIDKGVDEVEIRDLRAKLNDGNELATGTYNGGRAAAQETARRIRAIADSDGGRSTAIGRSALAQEVDSIAIGTGAKATGLSSISIGTGNVVSGAKSGALGDPSYIAGTGTYTIGNDNGTQAKPISANNAGAFGNTNELTGNNSRIVGNNNKVGQENTFVVGNDVHTTQANSVILGNQSRDRAGAAVNQATIQGVTYSGFAGQGSQQKGVVSVGAAGKERQIINVAPGRIAQDSTDAINGSQLYLIADKLGSGFNIKQKSQQVANIKAGNSINFKDGVGTIANTSSFTVNGGGADVTFDVNVTDFGANYGVTNGVVNAPGKRGNAFATAEAVANAINHAGFNLDVGSKDGGVVHANAGDRLVKAGNTVKLIAGKGVDIHRNGKEVTIAVQNLPTGGGSTGKFNVAGNTGTNKTITPSDTGTPTLTVKGEGAVKTEVSGTDAAPVITVKVDKAINPTANNDGKLNDLTTPDGLVDGATLKDAVNAVHFNAEAGDRVETNKDESDNQPAKIKAGDSIKLVAGKNIALEKKGNTFTYATKDDVTFKSVTVPTDGTNNVVINNNGINAGNKPITNVADGVNDKDAVNVSQLKNAQPKVEGQGLAKVSSDNPTGINGKTYTVNVEKGNITAQADGTAKTTDTDDNKVVTSKQLETTLNDMGFKVIADNAGKGTKSGTPQSTLVKAGNEVKFIAGDGMDIAQNGKDFTFKVNVDDTTIKVDQATGKLKAIASAPESTNLVVANTGKVQDPVTADENKVVTAGNMASTLNTIGFGVQANSQPTEYGGADKLVNAGENLNFVNGNQTTAKVTNTGITFDVSTGEAELDDTPANKGKAKTKTAGVATVENVVDMVNKTGFKVQANGTEDANTDEVINAGDTLNFKDGTNTTVTVSGNTVSVNVAADGGLEPAKDNATTQPNGKITPKAGDDTKLVNAKTVADAINESGFKVIADKTTKGFNSGTAPVSTLVKTGEEVKFTADEGVDIAQDGKDFKFKVRVDGNTIKINDEGKLQAIAQPSTGGGKFKVSADGTTSTVVSPVADENDAPVFTVKGENGIKTTLDTSTNGKPTIKVSAEKAALPTTVTNNGALNDLDTPDGLVDGKTLKDAVNAVHFNAEVGARTDSNEDKSDGQPANIKAGDTLKFTAGKNIALEKKGNEFIYATKDDVEFTSVTVPTDGTNKVVINNQGINAGNKPITNIESSIGGKTLAQAATDTPLNAVNVSDLKNAIDSTGFVLTTAKQDGSTGEAVNPTDQRIAKDDKVVIKAGNNIKTTQNGKEITIEAVMPNATAGKFKVAANDATTTKTITPDANESSAPVLQVKGDGAIETTIADGASGGSVITVKAKMAGEPTVSTTDLGKLVAPTTNPDGLVNGTTLVNAINKAGFAVHANNKPTEYGGTDKLVNAGDSLNFVDGVGTTANITADGITFDVAKEAAPQVANDGKINVPTQGDKFLTAHDTVNAINNAAWQIEAKADTAAGGSVTGSSVANVAAGNKVELIAGKNIDINQDGTKLTITAKDPKVKFKDTSTVTVVENTDGSYSFNATTGAGPAPAKPSGWKVQDKNGNIKNVGQVATDAPTLKVQGKNGSPITAQVTEETVGADKVPVVELDVATANVTVADGKAKDPDTADENKLVTAKNLADTVNGVSYKAATADSDEVFDSSTVNATGQDIKAGDTITYTAGKNLKVKQDGNNITFALAKDIGVNSVTLGDNPNAVKLVSDGGDLKLSKGTNNDPAKITNVTSGLNTYNDPAHKKGLLDLTNLPSGTTANTAATVGDLQNMGWVLSANETTGATGTPYSSQVKNADEVKFVGTGAAKVSGKDNTITVHVDPASVANTTLTVADGKVTKPDTNPPAGSPVGTVAPADSYVKAGDLATAMNGLGFYAKYKPANGTADAGQLITAGNDVVFEEGDNVSIERTGNTFKINANVPAGTPATQGSFKVADGTATTANSETVKPDATNAPTLVVKGKDNSPISTKVSKGVDDKPTIEIDVNAQDVVNRSQLPVVYTKADGTKVAVKDGKFYEAKADGTPDESKPEVPVADVIASMNDGANKTTDPMQLANVGSSIKDYPLASTTGTPISFKQKLDAAANDDKTKNSAVNVSDLKGLADTGLNFADDNGNKVNRPLGETLNVKGGNTVDGDDTTKNISVAVKGTDTLEVKLAKDINLGNDGSLKLGDTANPITINKDGINAGDKPITNVAGNLDGAKTGTTAPTTVSTQTPQSLDGVKNNAATVGDVLNAGWNLKHSDGKDTPKVTDVDFVRHADNVVFADGKGTTAKVDNTNGDTNTITYDVKVDGSTIKVNDDGNLEVIGGNSTKKGVVEVDEAVGTVSAKNDNGSVAPTGKAGDVATVGDVANAINKAGFKVADGKGVKADLVNAGDVVTFADGENTTAEVTTTATGATVKFNVKSDGKLTPETATGTPSTPTGKITAGNPTSLVTAETVADAINNAGWKVTGASGNPNVTGATETLIKPSDTVTFDAGKNMKLVQAGGKFTYATADDVVFNDVKTTTLTVGDTTTAGKPNVAFTAEGATPATNNVAGKEPVNALNLETNGKPVQIKGVGSSLNTQDVVTNSGKQGTTPSVAGTAKLVDLKGDTANPVNPNAAATVGDLQNLGWQVATADNGYNDVVKNADKVEFVGGKGVTVNGKTDGDKRVITIDTDIGQQPVVYTKADGTKVVEDGGKFYEVAADGKSADKSKEVQPENVIASMNNGKNETTKPMQLANVGSSIAGQTGANFKEKLDNANTATPNNAVNVSDLKGLADTGLNFKGDNGVTVNRPLGETLNVVGGVTDTAKLTDNNIGVVANTADGSLTVKLAKDINLGDDGSLKLGDQTNPITINKDGINAGNKPITNVAKGADLYKAGDTVHGKSVPATHQAIGLTNLETPAKQGNVMTVADAANMGWIVSAHTLDKNGNKTNAYADKVTNAREVQFIGKNGTTVKGETTADGVRTITIESVQRVIGSNDVKGKDGIKVEAKDKTDASGNVIKDSNGNAVKEFTVSADTVGLTTTNGKVDTPPTLKGLVDAENIAKAINETGFIAKSGDNDNGKLIKAGQVLDLVAGKNTKVTRQDTTDGNKFTFETKDEVEFNNVKVGDVVINKDTGINAGDKKIAGVAEGVNDTDAVNVKQLKNVGFKLATEADGGKANGATTVNVKNGNTVTIKAGKGITTTQDGSAITISASDVKKGSLTVNGGKAAGTNQDGSTAQAGDNGDVATVGDVVNAVNNSYWTLSDKDGTTTAPIKAGNTVKFVDGKGTMAVVKNDNNEPKVSFDVATAGLNVNTNGKVDVPTTDNTFATAKDVANAINSTGFTAKANGDSGQFIKAGDAVNFIAGDNINISRTNGDFTVATKRDVNFNSVQLGDVANGPKLTADTNGNIKVGDKNGQPVKITNVAAGTDDNDAVNLAQLKANKTKVEAGRNVDAVDYDSNTNTYTVHVKDFAAIKANVGGVQATADGKIAENAGNQTGDAASASSVVSAINNSGWNISSNGQNKELINPGDNVDFVNGKGSQVSVTTTGNKTEVKVDTPMAYVNANPDDEATPSDTVKMVGNDPVQVQNVASGVRPAGGTAAPKGADLVKAINAATGDTLNNAVNVGDLQAVAKASVTNVTSDDKSITVAKSTDKDTGATSFDVSVAKTELKVADGTTTANKGSIVAPSKADENKFVNAGDLAKTLNGMGFNVKANDDPSSLVTAGDTVTFKDGNNIKIEHDTATNSFTVKTSDNIAVAGNLNVAGKTTVGDLTVKPGSNVDMGGNVIGNVGANLVDSSKQATTPNANTPANLASKKGNAATVGDVLNAGWVLQNNGTDKDVVRHADKVNFANGVGTTIKVETNADKTVNTIKVDSPMAYVNTDATGKVTNDKSTPSNTVSLVGGNNSKPVVLQNIQSSIGDNLTGNDFNVALTNAAKDDTKKNNAVNVGDLRQAVDVAYSVLGGNISGGSSTGGTAAPTINVSTVGNTVANNPANGTVNLSTTGSGKANTTVVNNNTKIAESDGYTLTTYNVKDQKMYITNNVIEAIGRMNEQGIKFFHTNDGVVKPAVQGENSVDSSASGAFSTGIGFQAKAEGTNAIAMGNNAQALGKNSIAIGTGNVVTGKGSGAIGDPSLIEGDYSYSVGNDNVVNSQSKNVFILGNNAKIGTGKGTTKTFTTTEYDDATKQYVTKTHNATVYEGDISGAVALGNKTEVAVAGGVALGEGSVANRKAIDANATVEGDDPDKPKPTITETNGVVKAVYSMGNSPEDKNRVAATIKNTKAAVSVGGNGFTRQITNVAAGSTDTDAVNVAQLRSVADHITYVSHVVADNSAAIAANSAEIAKGIVIGDGKDAKQYALGSPINVLGDANVTTKIGDDGLHVGLSPDISVNSVTIPNQNGGSPVQLTQNGLDNGGNQIKNVADGTEPHHAVNLGQLQRGLSQAHAGTSSAMAMAALPQAYIPGKSMLTGGAATYNGEGAVAVGLSKLSDNGRWVLKVSGSADTKGNVGGAVGAGFHF